MGKKNWYFLVFSVLFAACSSSETYFGPSQSSSNILRGLVFNSAGETDLPSPVSIYVFDSSGKCAGIQTLQPEDEVAFSFTLSPGDYTLSVIAGASAEKYSLPDMDQATPDFPLYLQSPEDTHAELAVKTASIAVRNNPVKDLTIIVERVISQITASINDVPDDVASVSISLQPLEEYLLLDGTYGGDGEGKATFTLEKEESSGSWKTPIPVFVLPGSDGVSVTITFTDKNGSPTNHSYATTIPIEANCKTEITATYKAGSSEISGSIECSNWKDEHQVSIEFGDGSSNENEQNSINEMLTQGDIYKTCYILDVLKESSKQSTLLLMNPQSASTTIEVAVNNADKSNYAGLSHWRLLTVNEAKKLHTICTKGRLNELNELLQSPMVSDKKYLCMDANQKFYYFTIDTPEFETVEVMDSKTQYSARRVKEVTVEWLPESKK